MDLGCAPGGWTQVAVQRNKGTGQVVGIDILETEPVAGATIIRQDFTEPDAADKLKALLKGEADIVMSDMAANTTGHQQTDHLRTINLVELGYEFAKEVLAPGGIFIAKVFQGGAEGTLLADVKKNLPKSGILSRMPAGKNRRRLIWWLRDIGARAILPTIKMRLGRYGKGELAYDRGRAGLSPLQRAYLPCCQTF